MLSNMTKIKLIEKELEFLQECINLLGWCFEASKRCINDSYDEKEFKEKLKNIRTEIYDLTEDNIQKLESLFVVIISMQTDDELSLIDANECVNKVIILKQKCVHLKNEIADLIGMTKINNER